MQSNQWIKSKQFSLYSTSNSKCKLEFTKNSISKKSKTKSTFKLQIKSNQIKSISAINQSIHCSEQVAEELAGLAGEACSGEDECEDGGEGLRWQVHEEHPDCECRDQRLLGERGGPWCTREGGMETRAAREYHIALMCLQCSRLQFVNLFFNEK